jgi:GAF domain-containing protein
MLTADQIVSEVGKMTVETADRDELLRTTVRLLKENLPHYDWVGIYLLEGDTLVLHNYLGKPTDHTHIPIGLGVCGTAVATRRNQIIPDVTALDNYLACSLETRSEIVVLIRKGEMILGQLDIDSDKANAFGHSDEAMLNEIAGCLASRL